MKGTIRWVSVTPETGEFQYDISERDFDTDEKSIRDTIVDLLVGDWDTFGDSGDCIVIKGIDEDE